MKNRILITLIGLLTVNLSFGQDQQLYNDLVKEGSDLYEAKDFENSGRKYQAAFDALEGKAYSGDRYNAACSFALSNNFEKAFYHLYYLAENKNILYRNYDHLSSDSDLKPLYEDQRWTQLVALVKANKEEYEKDLDKPLVAELEAIDKLDQNYRRQIGELEEKYGRDSEEMKAHWNLINETDSINLIAVKKILDERGWLGENIIGDGNRTLFLVIQHADFETQVKYLPMMREAVELGNASSRSLALLEDRVALRQGDRQIYGSQVGRDKETGEYYVSPLIDPENVNARRAEVGLGTIESYISNWNMIWDLEKHKERTAKIEAEKKD